MAIKIYGMDISAPCRMAMMACEVMGIEYELVVVNLMAGENMKPEYLKVHILYAVCEILLTSLI